MASDPEQVFSTRNEPASTGEPILETEALTKSFGGFTAVDDVSLSIQNGEVKSIIGPNGAGKTTTFNMLMGALEPTSGTIRFEGSDITGEPIHRRPYLGISRSYQVSNVYPSFTVFENIQTACAMFDCNYYDMVSPLDEEAAVTEKTERLLELLGLESQQETLASSLSHGDKRHLEIGMGLASDPDLLLLDEPTAGMGATETASTIELITELAEDITILLVEHDIELVMQISDSITVLEQGRVIADGDPTSIQQNERVQDAYLGSDLHA
jgi:branched-chain amino acid transport system ATP-binding protein